MWRVGGLGVVSAAVATALSAAAPAETAPQGPWMVPGTIVAMSEVPDSSTVWAVKRGTEWVHWRLASYTPDDGWIRYAPPEMAADTTINDIAMVSEDLGWAVGSDPQGQGQREEYLLEWDGESWDRIRPPGFAWGDELHQISATSADNAWVLGCRCTDYDQLQVLWHWDGQRWRIVEEPMDDAFDPDSVLSLGPNNVWVIGNSLAGGGGVAKHWDGVRWQEERLPPSVDLIGDLAAASPNQLWAVAYQLSGSRAVVLHRTDGRWTVQRLPPAASDAELAIDASSGGGWIAGYSWLHPAVPPVAAHSTESGWAESTPPTMCGRGGAAQLDVVNAVDQDEVYVAGSCMHGKPTDPRAEYTLIMQYDGTDWVRR